MKSKKLSSEFKERYATELRQSEQRRKKIVMIILGFLWMLIVVQLGGHIYLNIFVSQDDMVPFLINIVLLLYHTIVIVVIQRSLPFEPASAKNYKSMEECFDSYQNRKQKLTWLVVVSLCIAMITCCFESTDYRSAIPFELPADRVMAMIYAACVLVEQARLEQTILILVTMVGCDMLLIKN